MLAKDINTFSTIIHRAFPHTISALIVFVGDEYTRLDFYHLGKRGRIFEIPFGAQHLLLKISKQFNISPALASSYLSLLGTSSLDFKTARKVEEILESNRKEFMNLWNESENFKVDSPYDVFVDVAPPFEEFFQGILKEINLHNKISVLGPQNELTRLLRTEYFQIF
jgi:hypothetical protein